MVLILVTFSDEKNKGYGDDRHGGKENNVLKAFCFGDDRSKAPVKYYA